jgi:S1-C subfamily serine protease
MTADGSGGSQSVDVTPGGPPREVRIVVDRRARLIGQVVDVDSGRPLANVEVAVSKTFGGLDRSATTTDANGRFCLENVAPGELVLLFAMDLEDRYLAEPLEVEVGTAGGEVNVGAIRLQAGTIRARIDDGSWDGVTGITMSQGQPGVVDASFPDAPAGKMGITSGDTILAIDGEDVREMSFIRLEWRLRDKPGTQVTITAQTAGQEPRTVTLVRHHWRELTR